MQNNFQSLLSRLVLCGLGLGVLLSPSHAQSQNVSRSIAEEPAARIGDKIIRDLRVDSYLRATVPGWPVKPELQSPLRKAAVEHLIRRELVHLWLKKNNFSPTPAEVEWQIDEIRADLERVEKKLDTYLTERQLTLEELQDDLDWELAWEKYLSATLTEEKIVERFQVAPRDFDGTELRVAQILLAVTGERDREQSILLAEKVRQQLQRGELGWDAAVREHSVAASRELGGELGWIRRHEPMPEDFSRVAFQLSEGELASPFASRFGVHIVKCLEVRPGKRQLGDVRELVRRDLMESDYLRLAELMRGEVEVWIRPEK